MNNLYKCENCSIQFDSQKALSNHQAKFCVNSKYGNIDNLDTQFASLSQGRDISIYGKMSLAKEGAKYDLVQNKSMKNSNVDAEYQNLLRQINDNEGLKAKLEKEKMEAFNQLKMLDKKQNELIIQNKRNDLQEIIKKRDQLAKEEDELEKEIRLFQNNKFNNSMAQSHVKKIDDDFVYREGREAGKLAMQRKLLEEKKREIQYDLKAKKREEEKIQKFLNSSQMNEQIYIPDYRNTEIRENRKMEQSRKMQTVPSEYPKSIVAKDRTPSVNQAESMVRSKISLAQETEGILKPDLFTGEYKTLFQNINPQNKTDEDLFLETLVAQQFDALNVLAKLPKNSQIYTIKLQQYQQMSKIRQQYKDKIQRKRLEKVKRQFEYEKKFTQAQKSNLHWLDQNRKDMLNKEVQILNEHQARKAMDQKSKIFEPSKKSTTKRGVSGKSKLSHLNLNEQMSNQYISPSSKKYVERVTPASGNDSNWGYKIELKVLKNYINGKPIKFKLVLKQQFNPQFQEGAAFEFQTQYHDDQAPATDRDPYHPQMRNRLDESNNIIYNQSFLVPQNLQALYNKNQREIYLYLISLQKDVAKISNQPSIHSWYCLKITHFGQVKEGIFTFNLYDDEIPYPLSADMNKKKKKLQEEVVIELSQVLLQKAKPPSPPKKSTKSIQSKSQFSMNSKLSIDNAIQSQKKQSLPKSLKSKASKSMRIKAPQTNNNISTSIDKQIFILNQEPTQFQSFSAGQALSFDFGVSSLRYLPTYCGPIKLQINFIDGDGNRIFEKEEILCELGDDMYNPKFDYHKMFRDFADFTTASFVFIRILTVCTLNYEIAMLGFSLINLFYAEDGMPIISDEASGGYFINGYFQIPIYWGSPEVGFLNLEEVNMAYPAIPCSSMLLEINLSKQAKPKAFPHYSEGCYNNMLCEVTKTDAKLFQQQHRREALDANQYVEGFLKFKGITKKYDDSQLLKFLSQSLAFNRQNTSNLMRLNSMAEYNPSFGIYVYIDKLILPKSKEKYYYFCTVCLSPPADYYLEKANDLQFLYKVDLNYSRLSEILLENNELKYHLNYNENAALIIELYRFKIKGDDNIDSGLEHCGHCIVPMFDPQEAVPCANVMADTIGLVDTQFETEKLRELQTEIVNYLQEYNQIEKNQFKLAIRVVNGFFLDQFLPEQIKNGQEKFYKTIFSNTKGFNSVAKSVKTQIQKQFAVKL